MGLIEASRYTISLAKEYGRRLEKRCSSAHSGEITGDRRGTEGARGYMNQPISWDGIGRGLRNTESA